MNLQLLFFALTILITIKSYPRALADYITSLASVPGYPAWFYTHSASFWARNQLFAQHYSNTATNNTKTATATSTKNMATSAAKNVTATENATKSSSVSCLTVMSTDQDLARKLEGLVAPMVIVLILSVLTIVV